MGIADWFGKKKSQPVAIPRMEETRALKSYMIRLTGKKTGVVVLEAGASGGEDTVEWGSFPEVACVHAFEPVKKSFDALNAVLSGNVKVKTYKLALSDSEGETTIHISSNAKNPGGLPSSSSILQPTGHLEFHQHIEFADSEVVKVTTIDKWAEKNASGGVDIMWLDMQGAEHLALKGGLSTLRNTKVVYTEVSLKTMYANSLLYPELRSFLESQGFVVEKEFLHWEDMGNVLFRKK